MEGVSKTSLAMEKARAFYNAQGCYWAGSQDLLLSLKKHDLGWSQDVRYQKEEGVEKKVFLEKLLITKKYLPLLALVPFSRIFFLGGSLVCGRLKETSDIDIIVVAKENRLWLNRLLLETVIFLLGRRRTQKKFKNRFCFNYSLSETEPVFQNQDFISAHFYKHLLPLWCSSRSNIKQFWRANSWLKSYSPLFHSSQKVIFSWRGQNKIDYIRTFLEGLLEISGLAFLLEQFSFWLQKRIITKKFRQNKKSPYAVLILKKSLIHYHFPYSNWKIKQDLFAQKMLNVKTVEKM